MQNLFFAFYLGKCSSLVIYVLYSKLKLITIKILDFPRAFIYIKRVIRLRCRNKFNSEISWTEGRRRRIMHENKIMM